MPLGMPGLCRGAGGGQRVQLDHPAHVVGQVPQPDPRPGAHDADAAQQDAERFGDQYRRIEAVAKIGDKFRVLDLKEAATRASVSTATTIKALYESADAFDYLP